MKFQERYDIYLFCNAQMKKVTQQQRNSLILFVSVFFFEFTFCFSLSLFLNFLTDCDWNVLALSLELHSILLMHVPLPMICHHHPLKTIRLHTIPFQIMTSQH